MKRCCYCNHYCNVVMVEDAECGAFVTVLLALSHLLIVITVIHPLFPLFFVCFVKAHFLKYM